MILWILIIVASIVGISLLVVLFFNYNPQTSIVASLFGEDVYFALKLFSIAAFLLFFPIFLFEGFSWLRLLLFVIGSLPVILALLVILSIIATEKNEKKIVAFLGRFEVWVENFFLKRIKSLDTFNSRINKWDEKSTRFFDKLETRLNKRQENSNRFFDKLETRLNKRQENSTRFFDKLETRLNKRQENSNRFFDSVNDTLNKFEERYIVRSIVRIENKIQKIERKKRIHFFDKIKLSVYKFQIKHGKPSSHTPSTSN